MRFIIFLRVAILLLLIGLVGFHEKSILCVDSREIFQYKLHLSWLIDCAVIKIQFLHFLRFYLLRLLLVHIHVNL